MSIRGSVRSRELADAARATWTAGPIPWEPDDRDAWLDWLLVTCVEPTLGRSAPTIVYDYPASQAALAVVRHDAVPVAERFELYVDGIELANGYHELTDAAVLRRPDARGQSGAGARTASTRCRRPAGCWTPCTTASPPPPASPWDSIDW